MDQSVIEHFEQQKQITKLSEAIRAGAKLRPQCSGSYQFDGKSCAYGAAAEVLGVDPLELHKGRIRGFNYNKAEEMAFIKTYGIAITTANDSGMTREAIADKLEAIGY
jgi:hypothetical protein